MYDNIVSFYKKHSVTLAGVLMLVAAAGIFTVWKVGPNQPQPLFSSADQEVPPHWRHGKLPFTINVLNHASPNWLKPLRRNTGVWSGKVVNFNIIPDKQVVLCEVYPESMNFCSWNEADGWLSQMMYLQGPDDPHIVAGVIAVNDAYLMNPKSEYNNDVWRNYILCQSLGWTMGVAYGFEATEDYRAIESCMNVYVGFNSVASMQGPDQADLREFAELYSHDDENPSSAVAYKTAAANEFWVNRQFGDLVQSLADNQQVYELDLGDGYIMRTVVVRIPNKK